MPRLSSEAISASLWRAEPIPQPPGYLKGDARKIYLEIVSHVAVYGHETSRLHQAASARPSWSARTWAGVR